MSKENEETDYNAKNVSADLVCVYLRDGRRTPQNDYEKRLLAEIKSIIASGKDIEVYHD